MKAKEAPEKLYVDTADNFNDVWVQAFRKPFRECGVEYIRTDAFIEKALAYLNEKFYFNNLHYAVENNTYNCMEEMFEDFRK